MSLESPLCRASVDDIFTSSHLLCCRRGLVLYSVSLKHSVSLSSPRELAESEQYERAI